MKDASNTEKRIYCHGQAMLLRIGFFVVFIFEPTPKSQKK